MDYRAILRNQLHLRKVINPRFSMRSLALKIALSPSKLSEVLQGKKSLSPKRATIVAERLGLRDTEKEIFVLSTMANSAEAKSKLKRLIGELNGQQTLQKNAWYFGAIKTVEEQGLDPREFADDLGLTLLQVENAQRFLRRIRRYHPERERLSFEPASLLDRLQDAVLSNASKPSVEFLFLNKSDAAEIERDIQAVLYKYKVKSKGPNASDLYWTCFTQFALTKKGDVC